MRHRQRLRRSRPIKERTSASVREPQSATLSQRAPSRTKLQSAAEDTALSIAPSQGGFPHRELQSAANDTLPILNSTSLTHQSLFPHHEASQHTAFTIEQLQRHVLQGFEPLLDSSCALFARKFDAAAAQAMHRLTQEYLAHTHPQKGAGIVAE